MAKRLLVKVNEADNVAIAVKEIKVGTQVSEDLVTRQDIPQAHKVALERIPKGQPVIRYGVILGYDLEDIEKVVHIIHDIVTNKDKDICSHVEE